MLYLANAKQFGFVRKQFNHFCYPRMKQSAIIMTPYWSSTCLFDLYTTYASWFFFNHFQNEIIKSRMLGSGKTIPKKNKKSSVFKIRLFVYKCVWCDWTMSANWFSATMLSIGLKKITLMLMFAKLSCSIYLAIRTRNEHHPY